MTAPNNRERILPRLIHEEIKESFINYSMSVIVSRALPDVRDGLKPVHRRVLYAMNELGLVPGRPYKKSATVVGDVLGKYHPHGDTSVYDALVRMVQDFSLRYPLVDGQGNFGSVDGDPAAAYRYTEARLTRIAMEMLADIDKKESSNKSQIVVTELPYQVNKAKLITDMAELVKEGKLEGISALRDESDKDGMRVVIELKRDAIPRVVLNQLYKHTVMQSTFGVIMLALVPDSHTGQLVPKVMPLKEVLQHYIEHRHAVVVRRTQFELDKALEREHILEGLKIAVDNIDAVIKLIRAAADTPTASTQLQKRFKLSERQAEAILNMRLAKLTGLEISKLEEELESVRSFIKEMKDILASKPRRMKIIRDELQSVADKYGDERRAEITSDEGEFTIEDLIAEEDMVITISHSGYIKRTSVSTYRKQRRGGRGLSGQGLKDEDFIEHLFIGSTHDYILCFTDDGRCFWP